MDTARPLRDVFADLTGGDDAGAHPDPAAVLAANGHAGLPAGLVAEAVGSYADTAPIEVAEHLSGYVMAHSAVPLPAGPEVDPGSWLDAVSGAPAATDLAHLPMDDDPHHLGLGRDVDDELGHNGAGAVDDLSHDQSALDHDPGHDLAAAQDNLGHHAAAPDHQFGDGDDAAGRHLEQLQFGDGDNPAHPAPDAALWADPDLLDFAGQGAGAADPYEQRHDVDPQDADPQPGSHHPTLADEPGHEDAWDDPGHHPGG